MTVDEIVNALEVEGVDEADQAAKRADVKKMLEEQRARASYFSKSRVGTAVGLPEFEVRLKPEFADKPPPNVPARPLSKEQYEAAYKVYEELVRDGKLVPSTSAFGSPIVMVRKPGGGGWRMALDFRLVNDCTVKQHYPLPHVQQCLDAMGKAKYFSTLDCISAFWNIPVSKKTQELTAVNFPWGKFAFTGMPMGMQAGC